jgi:hypothetical protein
MPGIPRELIEHHLAVCPQAHLVKQKTRKQGQEKQNFIIREIEKLKHARLYARWLTPRGLQIRWSCRKL